MRVCNLYLLTRDINGDDCCYESMIVAAKDETSAKNFHPIGNTESMWGYSSMWANSPDDVTTTLIGIALDDIEEGIILASFTSD